MKMWEPTLPVSSEIVINFEKKNHFDLPQYNRKYLSSNGNQFGKNGHFLNNIIKKIYYIDIIIKASKNDYNL